MSDEAAATPSAEAPPPVDTKPAETEPTKPKERGPDDDYDEMLKKSGGLKYKAAGKEKVVTSAAELRRILSRVEGTESAVGAAAKAKQAADAREAQISSIAKLKPAERLKALEAIGIPVDALRESVIDQILGDEAKEKEQAGLTDRERQMARQIEERDAKLHEHETARQRFEAEQAEAAQVAQSEQLYGKISSIAVGALKSAKIAPEHVNAFLPGIAQEIDRRESLGLDYDPQDIAETVVARHGALAREYYAGLDLESHLEELRSLEMPDPENPGKKTTRLKLMMRAEAKRIRASNGQPSSPVVTTPRVNGTKPLDEAAAFDAARGFGGGSNRW